MTPSFSAGIFLNAAVSTIVASAAIFLVLFLTRRWDRLGLTMRAYACFWGTTLLTWVTIAIRYYILSLDRGNVAAVVFDGLLQTFIFLSAPPLLYYLILRVVGDRRLARFAAILSLVASIVGIWFTVQTGGLVALPPSYFSADTRLSTLPLAIFDGQSILIFALLIADLGRHLATYRRHMSIVFETLYPIPIIIYLILGSIEQSGLVSDWSLVIFRVLYTISFLSVYIIMTLHESATETFLLHPGHTAIDTTAPEEAAVKTS